MKFLFVVQGEGRGHLSQAITLHQMLINEGHEVVKVLVGQSKFRKIPSYFTNTFSEKIFFFDSPNFLPTKRYTSIFFSIFYNLWQTKRYITSIRFLKNAINQTNADRVINFYEPLLGLTCKYCHIEKKVICIAHQYSYLHPKYIFPKKFFFRKLMLKYLTKITAYGSIKKIGLSFEYMPNISEKNLYIQPPLIRKQILLSKTEQQLHYHVYLLNEGFLKDLNSQKIDMKIHFFSDKTNEPRNPQIIVKSFDDEEFIKSLITSQAVISTAGFELVAEAMYLGKPLLLIPVNFEQQTNAFSAKQINAALCEKNINLKKFKKFRDNYNPNLEFKEWIEKNEQKIITLLLD